MLSRRARRLRSPDKVLLCQPGTVPAPPTLCSLSQALGGSEDKGGRARGVVTLGLCPRGAVPKNHPLVLSIGGGEGGGGGLGHAIRGMRASARRLALARPKTAALWVGRAGPGVLRPRHDSRARARKRERGGGGEPLWGTAIGRTGHFRAPAGAVGERRGPQGAEAPLPVVRPPRLVACCQCGRASAGCSELDQASAGRFRGVPKRGSGLASADR